VGRFALGVLVVAVVALGGSALYAHWVPRGRMRTHGAEGRVIRVQVWNGSLLRDGGFHVVEVENADRSDYFGTMVVARRPDLGTARAVAEYLGGPPIVKQAWASDLAEVTVVLGSDRSHLRLDR